MVEPMKNPFVHRLNLGPVDVIKIGVMSFTIAPIRILIAGILLLLAWSLASLSLLFQTEIERQKPLIGWRNVLRPLIVFLCRAVFFTGGFHWISVKGSRARTELAPIIALAPHSSYFDALPVVYLNLTTVVAKSEAETVPFFGKLIQFTQPVFVSREDPNSRLNTIKEINKRAHSKGAWPQIVIFPEGTCTNRSCLIGFKPGAFYPGVPVQPVCVRYPNKLDTITWTWDGPDAFKVLWYTLCQFHNNVEIEFLPVHIPNEQELKDPKLFSENVRLQMAKCLNCTVTDHTYDDCRLVLWAAKVKIPIVKRIVEIFKLHKKLGFNTEAMNEVLLRIRRKVSSEPQEKITYREFSEYLNISQNDSLQQLFKIYDFEQTGHIDLRDYVVDLCLVSGPATIEEVLKMAFQAFEYGHEGFIRSQGFKSVMVHIFEMSDSECQQIFQDIDSDNDLKITFDEFYGFSKTHPKYKKLYYIFQESTSNIFDLCVLNEISLENKEE
ncbi:lysophosphatidylcholine acyltransferase 1 isoform X2 [Octopus bimaculoides]|uniref:lysophosphatidylcholine acyltransferase 1 isoform X2 n=1 Tax=Octopus bimaculoides TaxID=37653 RepID=UPI0022E8F156|nr:lysophosphatidylcholine acyltransferase 1 isoform X2 [Octopus bimaculoides]